MTTALAAAHPLYWASVDLSLFLGPAVTIAASPLSASNDLSHPDLLSQFHACHPRSGPDPGPPSYDTVLVQ